MHRMVAVAYRQQDSEEQQQSYEGCTWQRNMIFPATLDFSIGDIRMPFSEEVKLCILGISIALFLVALIILIWQAYRYCTRTPNSKDIVTDLLADGKSAKSGIFHTESQKPNYKVDCRHEEVRRLSRCLSPGSTLADLGSSVDSLVDQEEEEEQVQGSLRFSLFYDQLQSQLVVTVLEAQGLAVRDFSRSVDPFIRVRLLWTDGEKEEQGSSLPLLCVLHEWQSRLVKDSCSPAFGDQFSCMLAEEEVPRVTVRLEVRDFDKYSRHGILGEVRVPLDNQKISYPLEILEDLQRPQKDVVGEVLLSLKYMPTSQRLEVGLLKIRTLSQPNKTNRALYARTSILCNKCKLRHQKTTQKTRWEVTVFNEVMIFMLPDPQIRECSIVVTVYEVRAGKKSSKRMIGQITLAKGKSSEDEHWKLMMRSLRQPIAKWHLLYI